MWHQICCLCWVGFPEDGVTLSKAGGIMKAAMTLQFWGVRGSIPTAELSTLRYGGNTACVSLDLGHNTCLVLDAGTGIRTLGEAIATSSTVSPRGLELSFIQVQWSQ